MAQLPAPPPWARPLPEAPPPAGLAVYQLSPGTHDARAAFAVRGGEFLDKRHFDATAIPVAHPKGDLLIDAGFGADVAAHVVVVPRLLRASYRATETVGEQLDASGYNYSQLLGDFSTFGIRECGDAVLQVPDEILAGGHVGADHSDVSLLAPHPAAPDGCSPEVALRRGVCARLRRRLPDYPVVELSPFRV